MTSAWHLPRILPSGKGQYLPWLTLKHPKLEEHVYFIFSNLVDLDRFDATKNLGTIFFHNNKERPQFFFWVRGIRVQQQPSLPNQFRRLGELIPPKSPEVVQDEVEKKRFFFGVGLLVGILLMDKILHHQGCEDDDQPIIYRVLSFNHPRWCRISLKL